MMPMEMVFIILMMETILVMTLTALVNVALEELTCMVMETYGGFLMIKEMFIHRLVETLLVWRLEHKLFRLQRTMK